MTMRQILIHVTHTRVLATMFAVAAVLEVIALSVAAATGQQMSPLNAAYAALTGGGVVWSYLALRGRIKGE